MLCLFLSLISIILLLLLTLTLYVLFGPSNGVLIDVKPISYKIALPKRYEGALEPNSLLNSIKTLFRDKLIGPKSVAVAQNGDLFTGTYGGHVYRIKDDNNAEIYTTIPDGRPIGMRIDSKGNLYFTEANSGLYVSDLKTGTVTKLIGFSDTKFGNNKESKFFDDLVLVETVDGVSVYITDVSNKFSLDFWSYTYLEPDPTGRVIKYDVKSKRVSVVLDHLWFPNGIEVNDDKNALLINELTKRRILKHYISGPKAGTTEVLIENLPGEPDNIRRSLVKGKETYWVGLALARDSSKITFCDQLSDKPIRRKLILRASYLLGTILNSIGKMLSIERLATYGSNLRTGLSLMLPDLLKYPGMALEIDSSGNILTSLQSSDNKVSGLSEIREVFNSSDKRVFYLGSAGNTYLGKLTLKV